jgi:hypothetical protein
VAFTGDSVSEGLAVDAEATTAQRERLRTPAAGGP